MKKESIKPRHEDPTAGRLRSCSGFRASSFFCHSSFVIRHCTITWILVFLLLLARNRTHAAPSNDAPGRLLDLQFQLPGLREKNSDQSIHLRGKDARQQLLLTAKFDTGAIRDYTRRVRYSVSPPDVVRIDRTGRITPLRD